MTVRSLLRTGVVSGLVLLFCVAAHAADNKSVIEVQKKAKANGHVEFSLTPEGGEAQTIEVSVLEKSKSPEIARDIFKEFAIALGDKYVVKHSGGSKITIKTVDKSDFKLVLSGQSVEGLSIVIK
jgi:hypothetical protein